MSFTTFTFFKLQGWSRRWWAFQQMGRAGAILSEQPTQVSKLLGTGGKAGFSLWPDWSTYVLLQVWETKEEAAHFFKNDSWYKAYKERATEYLQVEARAFRSQGKWNGVNPFENQKGNAKAATIGVLTRASIKPRLLPQFWRYVPGVSKKIFERPGLYFAKGVGEVPLLEQATFSLWDSVKLMQQFAYEQKEHARVVRKTRELQWYREELFARFEILAMHGNWQEWHQKIKQTNE